MPTWPARFTPTTASNSAGPTLITEFITPATSKQQQLTAFSLQLFGNLLSLSFLTFPSSRSKVQTHSAQSSNHKASSSSTNFQTSERHQSSSKFTPRRFNRRCTQHSHSATSIPLQSYLPCDSIAKLRAQKASTQPSQKPSSWIREKKHISRFYNDKRW